MFTSLDGPRYYNDKVRIKSNGSGTYDDITAGLLTLRNSNIDFVINTVLTDKNISGINNEYIEFLISTFGIKRIGIDVDLLHLYKYEVDDVVTVLIESQEFCNKLGVRLIGMYQSPFKHLEHCGTYFCAAQTGNSLAIDSDGSLLLCSFLPISIAADLNEYFSLGLSGAITQKISSQVGVNKIECNGCDFEKACNGGCLAVYKKYIDTREKALFNFSCRLYRSMTEYYIKKLLKSA